MAILRTTPNLEKCVIWLDPSDQRHLHSTAQHSTVQLLRLYSIHIYGIPTYLFDTLSLPELYEISIIFWQTGTATLKFTSLLSRCLLTKLSLVHHDPQSSPFNDEMIQILRACPSLVQLDLRLYAPQCMTTSFFAQFAYCRDPENLTTQQLVPMLRTMNIDYTGTEFKIYDYRVADHIKQRGLSF